MLHIQSLLSYFHFPLSISVKQTGILALSLEVAAVQSYEGQDFQPIYFGTENLEEVKAEP